MEAWNTVSFAIMWVSSLLSLPSPFPYLYHTSLTSLPQLEWLTAIPWPSSSTTRQPSASLEVLRDRAFLTKAREQLDADHFGLEKIKKRLIEYLAVVRLKELNAEEAEKQEVRALEKANDDKAKEEKQHADGRSAVIKHESDSARSSDSESEAETLVSEGKPITQAPKRASKKSVKGPILLLVTT